jgi:hypothetical protein
LQGSVLFDAFLLFEKKEKKRRKKKEKGEMARGLFL